jgi:hypothetical protein
MTEFDHSDRPPFQIEPRELITDINARGHISPWEFLRICAWKSAKNLAWVSLNSEAEIQKITAQIIFKLTKWNFPQDIVNGNLTDEQWVEWESMTGDLIGADKNHGGPSGLLSLHGVGYPVATAILAFLNPLRFPVMDKWAVDSIFEEGSATSRWHRKAAYRAYAQKLTVPDCAVLSEISTLRERDIYAMELAQNQVPIPGLKKIKIP